MGVVREIENILEDLEPTKFLVDQSLYQLRWFVDTTKKFTNVVPPLVDRVDEIIDVFEDYSYWL